MKHPLNDQSTSLLDQLTSKDNVQLAYHWLCLKRKHFPANADVWHLRFSHQQIIPEICIRLRQGHYRFSPAQVFDKQYGHQVVVWCAEDALVFKMLTEVLQDRLPVHQNCVHVKGHGGAKQSVKRIHQWISSGAYPYVISTDIRGYYAHINKHQLLDQLAKYIHCPVILNLLGQYLSYSVEQGGSFHTPTSGISRSCPLSPLLGAFHLYTLDTALSKSKGLRYQRFMDDFVILCQTHWQLRRCVATLNRALETMGFEKHPDKTFIGRITKGFDWLGYRIDHTGIVGPTSRAVNNFTVKLNRLYEQAWRMRKTTTQVESQVVDYVERWCQWLKAGLDGLLPKDIIYSINNRQRQDCRVLGGYHAITFSSRTGLRSFSITAKKEKFPAR